MKNSLCIFFGLLLFTQCQDPIEVEVFDSQKRLVVEAQINWIKETQQTEQEVFLSLSSSYFSDTYLPASGAIVSISDSNQQQYTFYEEINNPGRYIPLDTVPYTLNQKLQLKISYNGQEYIGSETFMPVTKIDSISQNIINFFGEETISIDAFCMDPKNEKNYAFFEFTGDHIDITEFNVYRDDFNDGFIYNGFLFGSDFEVDDKIRIRQYGLSKKGFNYWNLLINQNTQQGGSSFQTTPSNLTGNITNLTKPNNYPLGYFRASEVSEVIFAIK
tara:strand:+ start:2480 stop:3301 length:822 start_codon:yes stop_codon:yes gene_type:complete